MKKKILGLILGVGICIGLMGCEEGYNKQLFDTTWKYNKAIIVLGDNEFEIEIESWSDYDVTTVQFNSKDGQVYLTDMKNAILIKE